MTHTANENDYDMLVDLSSHISRGNVWKVLVDLSMKGAIDEPEYIYTVAVEVVAPNRDLAQYIVCLLYTSPSPRDRTRSRMPSSA